MAFVCEQAHHKGARQLHRLDWGPFSREAVCLLEAGKEQLFAMEELQCCLPERSCLGLKKTQNTIPLKMALKQEDMRCRVGQIPAQKDLARYVCSSNLTLAFMAKNWKV